MKFCHVLEFFLYSALLPVSAYAQTPITHYFSTLVPILSVLVVVLLILFVRSSLRLYSISQKVSHLDKNKLILNKLPIWVAVINREGKYLFLHDANIDNTPVAKRKVGKSVFDLYDTAYALEILRVIDDVIKNNETQSLEYKRFPEGPWLLGTCVKLNDSIFGEPAVLWTAGNIHAQKQANTELEQKTKIIDIIQKNVETKYERDFLIKLTEQMCDVLEADCVFIADFSEKEHENHCETIIFSGEEKHNQHAAFMLSSTLVDELKDREFFNFPQQVSSIFKDEQVLVRRQIKHGVGITLRNSSNQVIGILCALFKRPVEDLSFTKELLRLFADRASSELERENTEKRIREGEEKYKSLFTHVNISLLRLDKDWKILEMNEQAHLLLDVESELPGENFLDQFVSQNDRAELMNEMQNIPDGKSKCGYLMNITTSAGMQKNVIWNIVREGQAKPTGFILSGIDMTERHETADTLYKLKEDLAYHEHHLRITLASLGEGVISTDMNGSVVEMNPAAEKITGWDAFAAKGVNVHDVFHVTTSDHALHPFDQVIKTKKIIISYDEIAIQSRDAYEHPVAFTASPLRDGAGKNHGVVLVFRDVSEEIEQRKQLEDAHSLLQQLMDNLPVYVYVKDPDDDFRYIYINYEIGKDKSLLPGDILGKTDFDVFSSEEAKVLRAHDNLIFEKDERYICEETVTAVTGEQKQLRTIRTLIHTDEDKSILLGISLDITEQVVAERAVRRNEARLSAIMANSPYMVLLLDQYYRPMYFNAKALEMTGYTDEEMWEQSLESLTPPKYREKSDHFLEKLFIEKREFVTFEETLQCADRSACPVRITYVPIYSESNENFNLLLLAEDIHQKQEMERQLHHAQRMESVGRLAGSVAHDFNNLLQVIIGLADFLKEAVKPDSEEAEMVSTLMGASESATELVQQLLLFSRKEPGEKESVNLAEITRNFLKMIRRVIGKDINVSFSADENIYDLYADKGRMEQVIMNLCINSKDAIDKSNGEIAISIHNEQVIHEWQAFNGNIPRGSYVLLKVEDNGSGISAKDIDKIFDPFFTTKDPGKGTGLGLSTVFGIVEEHKGYLNVKSTPGKGTTFMIYFPQYRTTNAGLLREKRKEFLEKGKALTILYAEDDPLVRNLIIRTLELAGHKLFVAENGRQAVDLFEEHASEIQLCIFDVIMPEMGGDEAYQSVLQINANTPVIFTTGYTEDRLNQYVWNKKFVEILAKPFVAHELKKSISKVIKRTETLSTLYN